MRGGQGRGAGSEAVFVVVVFFGKHLQTFAEKKKKKTPREKKPFLQPPPLLHVSANQKRGGHGSLTITISQAEVRMLSFKPGRCAVI